MAINSLTTKHVIIRIIVIVSSVEFLIMLTFSFFDYEVNVYVKAGTDILALAALSTPLIVILVVTPHVRARDEAPRRLNNLAETDPLTNLLNRRSIYSQLHKYFASANRHNFYGAVLLIDLAEYKYINDAHGHDAGDKVLIDYDDKKFSVGASIGIRIFGLDEIEAESAIKDADKAMYRVKEAGIGQCVVYED